MIKYDSPEWKRISQCLIKLGIYGTGQCRQDEGAYVAYDCSPEPALKILTFTNGWMSEGTVSKANEAIALLQEKYPEYDWHRQGISIIRGRKK